jgi:hypothetical protein
VSKSSNKHEAPAKLKRRGPKNKPTDDMLRFRDPTMKPVKQRRVNDRARLRKEYL